MCGRIVQACGRVVFAAATGADRFVGRAPTPSWNIAPTQSMLVAADDTRAPGRVLATARWSLVPRWSRTDRLTWPTFNARAESAAEKPTYRDAVRHARCVVPVDGYYEWQPAAADSAPHLIPAAPDPAAPGRRRRPSRTARAPWHVHRADGTPLLLAGLYSWWCPAPNAPWTLTATILTTQADASLAWLHPRQPLPIASDRLDAWLAPDADGPAELRRAVAASPGLAPELAVHRVAPLHGDGPGLVVPVDGDGTAPGTDSGVTASPAART